MDIESIIAWALPSLALIAWGVLLAFALPRLLMKVIKPGRTLVLAISGLYAALFAIGLWLWAVAEAIPGSLLGFVFVRTVAKSGVLSS